MSEEIKEWILSVWWLNGDVTCTDHDSKKEADDFGRLWLKDGAVKYEIEMDKSSICV